MKRQTFAQSRRFQVGDQIQKIQTLLDSCLFQLTDKNRQVIPGPTLQLDDKFLGLLKAIFRFQGAENSLDKLAELPPP